jgi:DNA polymerase III subunit delta'
VISFDDILGQAAAVEFLRGACRGERLPHALLLAGPAGVGKGTCAMALAGWFLCHHPRADRPCGVCESCRLLPSGNHPDHHVIAKELIRFHDRTGRSKGIDLSINVIRPELIEPAGRTAALGHGKFFVVEQAEQMSVAAQNALLKTLEEPPGRTVIALLSDAAESLLATVRSRCQMVRFAPLEAELIQEQLQKRGIDAATAAEAAALSGGSLGGAANLIAQGILPQSRRFFGEIDHLLAGRPADDLAGWFKQSADAIAEAAIQRDPLGSKEAAMRAGLALYLHLAAERFSGELRKTNDPDQLERICRAIDAIGRCRMYLEANVNTAVALNQLAAAWANELRSV